MFKTARGEEISKPEIIQRIAEYILKEPKAQYEITVGTDSQNHKSTKMVEVIAIHKTGQGGLFFYDAEYIRKISNIKQKIVAETMRSLNVAEGILDGIEEILFDNGLLLEDIDLSFQIHCDIGKAGKTNILIQEITSWVQSCGYDCCIKPYSYAASGIANKFTKQSCETTIVNIRSDTNNVL